MHRLLICLSLLACLSTNVAAYSVSTSARIVAIGDVHGAYDGLVSILRKAAVIDSENHWIGGDTQLVSVGDILDRGPDSRKALDLLITLESEAEAVGGRLHFVLGNHEVLVLTSDYEYVSDAEFAAFATDGRNQTERSEKPGEQAMREAFSADGRYGQWLLEKPVIIKINDVVFTHGGLSKQLNELSLDDINAQNKTALTTYLDTLEKLVENDYLSYRDSFSERRAKAAAIANGDIRTSRFYRTIATDFFKASSSILFVDDGPTWYRGSARCHPYTEYDTLDQILSNLGASRLVIGHTPTFNRRITSRFDQRVLSIDTGMLASVYRGRAAALVIDGNQTHALYDGENDSSIPFIQRNRLWNYPGNMDDDDVADFLGHAPITDSKLLSEGVTRPMKLTLSRDGISMNAVFKNVDTDPKLPGGSWKSLYDKADRYHHDIAAYKLDRLLGFDMVPVAVERTVNGRKGVVQYWIPDSINEKNRKEQKLDIRNAECPRGPQWELMNTFDRLIANDDRNQSNILYTQRDWRVWLIDHTRAFRSKKRFPRYLRKEGYLLPEPLRQRLQALNEEALTQLLSEELHPRQIKGILLRAERLLSDD